MANNFVALSVVGGSLNTWGTTLNTLIQAGGIGALTAELYNDSGTLKLSKGKVGINNGVATGIGVCIIDTITTISTAGMTAGLWHAIEISVSGTAVTIEITPIVGASDESVIDAATKAAYDYEKTGYYLTASKRLIGVVFLRAALALGRIVNCESGKLGFKGIEIINYYSGGVTTKKYVAKMRLNIGSWNMVATSAINLAYGFDITAFIEIQTAIVIIISDSGLQAYPILYNGGGAFRFTSASSVNISRAAGGAFDNTSFDDPLVERGYVIIQWYT